MGDTGIDNRYGINIVGINIWSKKQVKIRGDIAPDFLLRFLDL